MTKWHVHVNMAEHMNAVGGPGPFPKSIADSTCEGNVSRRLPKKHTLVDETRYGERIPA